MAINKVVLGNDTLLDLTADTVAPEHLAQGYTAHDAAGNAIVGTMTGGGGGYVPTDEELAFEGNCNSLFCNNRWDWVIENYGSKIKMTNITSASYLFKNSSNLKTIQIGNFSLSDSGADIGSMFDSCYSLRSIDSVFLSKLHNSPTQTSRSFYNSAFGYCYCLDEINDLQVDGNLKGNIFSDTFKQCKRLKNITFKTTNGVAEVAQWSSQMIDLSNQVGYGLSSTTAEQYGIPDSKWVFNTADYEALKNDPDWFTSNVNYSRYNHDSAVATINSLPDTSAYLAETSGVTNTIKFKGEAGTSTDGGAINTLTEEEIAVATAKGWSVALV